MKKFLILLCWISLSSWGFYAHKQINYLAVFSLPADMLPFYKQNISYLREHATDPDKRRYMVEGEDVKHYFDADHWAEDPFCVFPLSWDSACTRFGEDSIRAYGILPWNLQWSYYGLVSALDSMDAGKVMKRSADLGHYIADATVPLHTTENYNGQLTNQHGIHGFWESALPETYFDDYDLLVGRASYIRDKPAFFWKIIEESHSMVDSVLRLEKEIRESLPEKDQSTIAKRNGKYVEMPSRKLRRKYHDALQGMVERRLRRAILAVADVWYSAWVDAGQPDMSKLDAKLVKEQHLALVDWFSKVQKRVEKTRGHLH